MSRQHAEAYVAGLYDYEDPHHQLETQRSAYARRFMRYRLGEDVGSPASWHGPPPGERRQIEARVDRELAR